MPDFKTGDRVRLVKANSGLTADAVGLLATLKWYARGYWYFRFDGELGDWGENWSTPECLELVERSHSQAILAIFGV